MKYLSLFLPLFLMSASTFSQAESSSPTGKDVYVKYCLTCHQQDGKGVPKLNPPLIKTSYVTGDTKNLITWVLQGSGEEKVPIDGNYYNNNMPPQSALKDEELAKVLTYIRSSWGNKAGAVSSAEVKAVRGSLK